MHKKSKRIILILLAAAVTLIFVLILSFGSSSEFADMVMPERIIFNSQSEEEPKNIDMSEKGFITLGKYGFVRKLEIQEKTALTQRIYDDELPANAIMYGVYRDRKLNDPVDEVDVAYNMKADIAIDNGEDESEFKKYKYMVSTVLDPGVYYVAVYTKRFWDSFSLSYESQWAVIEGEINLTEGEERIYYGSGTHDTEVYCRIKAPRDGIIQVTSHYFAQLQFFDKNHQTLSEIIEPVRNKRTKGEISVQKDQIYYAKVSHPAGDETSNIRWWIIKYAYI